MTQAKPSKTQRKREQQALQALGERLVELGEQERRELALGDRLEEAITDLEKMNSREAIRRQKQYIGKLMRDVDPQPILELFARREAAEQHEQRLFASAERWRARLLADPDAAATEFAAATGAERTSIEALLERLAKAHSDREEKTARRELFRAIRAALEAGGTDVRIPR